MNPLSVVLYGLEEQDAQLFHKTFNSLNDNVRHGWRCLTDNAEADAELIIVDIDSIHGHMDWLKATGAGQRTAVFTTARHTKESDLVLSKPLLAAELAAVLLAVAAEHAGRAGAVVDGIDVEHPQDALVKSASATASEEESPPSAAREAQARPAPAPASVQVVAQPVVKPTRSKPTHKSAPAPVVATAAKPRLAAVPKLAPEPEPQPATIGEWLRIGKFEHPVCISGTQERWTLDPDRKVYHGPAALKPLLEALAAPLDRLQRADIVALESARKQPSQPLARLRWVAGLGASPGKLLPELADATSLKLGRWPQIEREYPRHFRIATAMMKQAGSVDEITAASGAPRGDVVDFINAYHTLGYIVCAGEPEEIVVAPRERMMSRIRKPFGR